MADISFNALAARAAAIARALSPQLGDDSLKARTPGSTESSADSFGDLLIKRQQQLLGDLLPNALAAPLEGRMPILPAAAASIPQLFAPNTAQSLPAPQRTELLGPPSLSTQPELQAPEPPTTIKVGAFGHWELRPEPRPFPWLREDQLDRFQSSVVEKWKVSPYRKEWVYDVQPGPENNWGGWGPPPASWVMRDGAGRPTSQSLPWPPPGEPAASWGTQEPDPEP